MGKHLAEIVVDSLEPFVYRPGTSGLKNVGKELSYVLQQIRSLTVGYFYYRICRIRWERTFREYFPDDFIWKYGFNLYDWKRQIMSTWIKMPTGYVCLALTEIAERCGFEQPEFQFDAWESSDEVQIVTRLKRKKMHIDVRFYYGTDADCKIEWEEVVTKKIKKTCLDQSESIKMAKRA